MFLGGGFIVITFTGFYIFVSHRPDVLSPILYKEYKGNIFGRCICFETERKF